MYTPDRHQMVSNIFKYPAETSKLSEPKFYITVSLVIIKTTSTGFISQAAPAERSLAINWNGRSDASIVR